MAVALALALNQGLGALRAVAAVVALLKGCQVNLVGLLGLEQAGRHTAFLEGLGEGSGFIRCENLALLAADEGYVRHGDIGRQLVGRFQSGVRAEVHEVEDGAIDVVLAQPKELNQGHDMSVVLMEGILEFELVAVGEGLGPLRLIGSAEDPTSHILGLNHEDAEARNDDMVDLGGRAVGKLDRNVVELVIDLAIESDLVDSTGDDFADGALDDRLPQLSEEPAGEKNQAQ